MNIEHLLAPHSDRVVRYALTGAKGGYGRTLVAQTTLMANLHASILCDLDPEGTRRMAIEVGAAPDDVVICETVADVESVVAAGLTAVVARAELVVASGYDVLVEATGNPSFGYRVSCDAIDQGRHVAMVSKEVDSLAGPDLAARARRRGVVYTPASGDQPANLVALVSWVRALGFDVVAIGKSSEYDLVFDPARGTVTQLDTTIDAPELGHLLVAGSDLRATLDARAAAVSGLTRGATADYCEMAVVATHTGYTADTELMHYPVARISELADVYIPVTDGGLLESTGVVDVFSVLRTPDEASFAGGVFVVVRTHDDVTWEVLRAKGHVVSRNGSYACVYLPYHFMGVETPLTLLSAVLLGVPFGARQPERTVVLAGRTKVALAAGTRLDMGGHHHDVTGVQAILLNTQATAHPDAAPLYLAAHCTLARDVPAGAVLTIDDLSDPDPGLLAAWTSIDAH